MTQSDRYDDRHDPRAADDRRPSMVLHGEEVEVYTEKVATGVVRLRKRVVTEEISVPVTIRREEIEILEEAFDEPRAAEAGHDAPESRDRADDQRAAGESSVRHLDSGDVEITLYAERPVVTMEVVAVERVRVSRGVVTDTERVTVDVSREEAHVEEQRTAEPSRGDARDGHGLEGTDRAGDPRTPGDAPTGR
ncbi:MAG: DUF2382 domain-containing protein [Mobilicoccus sp.]|nr:DUF2382 domain-containing protein [Mobilicoccus sp.]